MHLSMNQNILCSVAVLKMNITCSSSCAMQLVRASQAYTWVRNAFSDISLKEGWNLQLWEPSHIHFQTSFFSFLKRSSEVLYGCLERTLISFQISQHAILQGVALFPKLTEKLHSWVWHEALLHKYFFINIVPIRSHFILRYFTGIFMFCFCYFSVIGMLSIYKQSWTVQFKMWLRRTKQRKPSFPQHLLNLMLYAFFIFPES